MKKVLWFIAIVLTISLPAYGWIMAPIVGGVAGGGGQAAAYFGYNNTGTNAIASGDYVFRDVAVGGVGDNFICPGTGTRTIDAMEAYTYSAGGTPGNMRLALYDTSLNLVIEADAEVSVSSTSPGWVSQTSFTGTAQCTGGTTYYPTFTADSSDVMLYRSDVGSSGDSQYLATDYTGGYPNPIAGGGALDRTYSIRVHVAAVP